MPGPAPKQNAVRRNIRPDWVRLPSEGRTAPAPKWPLGKPTAAEAAVWKELWSLPQALMWEKFRWWRTVARYVRILQRAEVLDASRDAMSEARQLEEHLGLTPKAMKALLWVVVDDEVAAKRDDRGAATEGAKRKRQTSAKTQTAGLAARLTAVN
jgi:hypothetical protein